jgi:acyl carrier protein
MDDFEGFVANFTTAVDFQEQVDIKADTLLADLPEWDSLAALGVIVMFDMEYGITISGNDLKDCQSISDIYKLIAKKKA